MSRAKTSGSAHFSMTVKIRLSWPSPSTSCRAKASAKTPRSVPRSGVSFTLTDVMLRANGYFLDVDPLVAHKFITEAMERKEFRFPQIREWIRSIVKPIED